MCCRPEDLILAGVDASQVDLSLALYKAFNGSVGMTFGIITEPDDSTVLAAESAPEKHKLVISNILSGYGLCGTDNKKQELPMVCSTTIGNHETAMLEVKFMTDGTTASIAPKVVQLYVKIFFISGETKKLIFETVLRVLGLQTSRHGSRRRSTIF